MFHLFALRKNSHFGFKAAEARWTSKEPIRARGDSEGWTKHTNSYEPLKIPSLFRVYRGFYYPVLWGLQ